MALVATLIADPSNPLVDRALADHVAATPGFGPASWLADGIAADFAVTGGTSATQAESRLREVLGDWPVDVAVQEQETRRKSLLIADMDSTIIDQECIDELAAEVGLKDKVATITARAMNGEIPFEAALRERVRLLANLPVSVVQEVLLTRITLASGGQTLVRTMKHNGAHTALVSGGFTLFTGPVALKIGFHEHHANILEVDGKHLTGRVHEPILGKQAKVDTLSNIAVRLGIRPRDAIAVGDGANDLGMLALAGTGVALHAKPVVAAQAKFRIDHGDLTALLYLQGYRQNEFVGT